jgi:glutamate/aspartate transport system substrate-binding protein
MNRSHRLSTQRITMLLTQVVAAAIVLTVFMTSAAAEEPLNGTLKKIKDSGAITLAVRESAIPFSYYDNQQNIVGYSEEYAFKVVDALKHELKMPGLKVNMIPVTPQNRMSLLQNGTVDLECGSTTNNLERQKQVAFSTTIFVIGTRLLTKKTSGIKDFPDLKGKTLVTNAGSTSEVLLRKMNFEKNMGMNIISARDHAESFLTLETGRAAAFMMDDVLLYGDRMTAKHPEDWVVVGTPQSFEAYGCMLRKDDPQFKKFVDSLFTKILTSSEANRIYKKWLQSPIPPKGLNMDFPMTPAVAEAFKQPNDKALQ